MAQGDEWSPEYMAQRDDEIGRLTRAFTVMQRSIKQRLNESALLDVSEDVSGSLIITARWRPPFWRRFLRDWGWAPGGITQHRNNPHFRREYGPPPPFMTACSALTAKSGLTRTHRAEMTKSAQPPTDHMRDPHSLFLIFFFCFSSKNASRAFLRLGRWAPGRWCKIPTPANPLTFGEGLPPPTCPGLVRALFNALAIGAAFPGLTGRTDQRSTSHCS
ncbi:MAG: hypothetical protein M5U34_41720 [Chloroflexi bacterium]|nr:hypothetical protein [Chloroflexota bacterium]